MLQFFGFGTTPARCARFPLLTKEGIRRLFKFIHTFYDWRTAIEQGYIVSSNCHRSQSSITNSQSLRLPATA